MSTKCHLLLHTGNTLNLYSSFRCCLLKAVPTSAQGRDAVSTTLASVWSDGQLKTVTWGRVAVVTMATVRQDFVSVTSVGTESTARTRQLATR